MMKINARGFTLMELMVTVAIIAILSALAVPAYSKYAMRGRRSDAINALMAAAAAQEKFYFLNNRYATTAELNLTTSSERYYNITVDQTTNLDTSAGYTLLAVPVPGGPQAADTDCAAFKLDAQGARTPSPDPNACWHR